MPAKGNMGRRFNIAQLCIGVMGDHGVRLRDERIEGLYGATSDKLGQGFEVIGLCRIEFRRNAPRENPQHHHLRYASQASGLTSKQTPPYGERDVFESRGYGAIRIQLSGYLAASHIPVAAPSERPLTWALDISRACINAAISSANNSVE